MTLTDRQKQSLAHLTTRVRSHFDRIEQDVPTHSFLVGGAVRDALLGIESQDFDFVVVGETPESMQDRGFEPIEASSFPVLHDSEHEEWALARTEQKAGEGYTGFDVFTDDVSLQSDLERRDLALNSLVIGSRNAFRENGELIPVNTNSVVDMALHSEHERTMNLFDIHNEWFLGDAFTGVADIENGVLRHVSDAFAEDPLRCLRVARYAGRFAVPTTDDTSEFDQDFEVADETMDMMRRVAPELNRMSRDRIGTELVKALDQARRPSRIFEVLRDSGALAVLFPELDRAEIVLAGPQEHHVEGSTAEHTRMVLDRMHELCEEQGIEGHDRVRRLLMALAHDIGKVIKANDVGGIHSDDPPTRFGGHADAGAERMSVVAERLGLSAEFENVMEDACGMHMDFHDLPMMAPNELLEFLDGHLFGQEPASRTLPMGAERDNGERKPVGFHNATVWELLDLAEADHTGRIKLDDDGNEFVPEFDREPFENRIEAVIEANEIEGYEALEEGLCDEHAESEIDRDHGIHVEEDKSVQAVMSACPSCRTPGEWVGDMLDQMCVERLNEVLRESENGSSGATRHEVVNDGK